MLVSYDRGRRIHRGIGGINGAKGMREGRVEERRRIDVRTKGGIRKAAFERHKSDFLVKPLRQSHGLPRVKLMLI